MFAKRIRVKHVVLTHNTPSNYSGDSSTSTHCIASHEIARALRWTHSSCDENKKIIILLQK